MGLTNDPLPEDVRQSFYATIETEIERRKWYPIRVLVIAMIAVLFVLEGMSPTLTSAVLAIVGAGFYGLMVKRIIAPELASAGA